jgi:hypothetical protein
MTSKRAGIYRRALQFCVALRQSRTGAGSAWSPLVKKCGLKALSRSGGPALEVTDKFYFRVIPRAGLRPEESLLV